MFASGVHPVVERPHAAVVNVWLGVVPLKVMCAVGKVKVTLPLPGAWPVTVPMPLVTVPAGSSGELKALVAMAGPDAANAPERASLNWKSPANVPGCGKVKFTVPAPFASVVNEARFRQLGAVVDTGNWQNWSTTAVLISVEPVIARVPAPLLAVVSRVKVPT